MLIEYDDEDERREIAKRYPPYEDGQETCGQRKTGYFCTRGVGHELYHVAHGEDDRAVALWDDN